MTNYLSALKCDRIKRFSLLPNKIASIAILIFLLGQAEQILETADEPPSRPPLSRNDLTPPVITNGTEHVVVPIGRTAHLHCQVRHLADKTVSWVRRRDLNILTVGVFTYTNDKRFQALHSTGSSEWTLKILAPKLEDSGVYECQVSTEPKLSRAFMLDVVVSRAEIFGSNDVHIRAGSAVNLTCHVTHGVEPIFWFRGQQVVAGDLSPRDRLHVSRQDSISSLRILSAAPDDTGNYTCAPLGAIPASVYLHVLSEEPPAAMQHNTALGLFVSLDVMAVLLVYQCLFPCLGQTSLSAVC